MPFVLRPQCIFVIYGALRLAQISMCPQSCRARIYRQARIRIIFGRSQAWSGVSGGKCVQLMHAKDVHRLESRPLHQSGVAPVAALVHFQLKISRLTGSITRMSIQSSNYSWNMVAFQFASLDESLESPFWQGVFPCADDGTTMARNL